MTTPTDPASIGPARGRSFELRRAGARDVAVTFAIKRAAFRAYVEQLGGWNDEKQLHEHARRFGAQEVQLILAREGVVGFLGLCERPGAIDLHQLYLKPEAQGRGLGGQCLDLLKNRALRRGLTIHLQVLKVNPRAMAFYRRAGFRPTGESTTHVKLAWTPGNAGSQPRTDTNEEVG